MKNGFDVIRTTGATHRFSIDRNTTFRNVASNRLHPRQKAPMKLVWLNRGNHAPNRVAGRNAIFEWQKGAIPLFKRTSIEMNVIPTICTTQNTTNRQGDDIQECM